MTRGGTFAHAPEHHKTGGVGWHPIEASDEETGETICPYPEAEAVLSRAPRRGVSVVVGPKG